MAREILTFVFALLLFKLVIVSVQANNTYITSSISKLVRDKGVYFLDPSPATNHVLPVQNFQLQPTSLVDTMYYTYFSIATYCSADLSSWTCSPCQVLGPNVRFVIEITNSTFDTMVFVAIDDTREEIVISFRGTYNAPNAVSDLTFTKVSIDDKSDIQIHKGFYDATLSLYPEVVKVLKELIRANPTYKVVINGHSLGGSEASITLFLFKYKNLFPKTNFELFTYGAPRQGNLAYATYMNKLGIPSARVVNRADIIPHLAPHFMGFVHHGNEVFTVEGVTRNCSNAFYEDLNCSNSLGPLYSATDHLEYFNVSVFSCTFENPAQFVLQAIVQLNHYIPAPLMSELQLNSVKLTPKVVTVMSIVAPPLGK